MKNQETISRELKFEGNPRQITKKAFDKLKKNIEHLGDLGGIVYCHNNNAYVGGNQRCEILDGSEIVYTTRLDRPDKTKSVAYGYIHYKGSRYAYREVNFTKKEFRKAVIVANASGGKWDYDELANNWDEADLKDWEVPIWETQKTENKPTKALQIKFSPEDIGVARELINYFKDKEIYIGGEILDKLKELRENVE